MGQRGTYIHTYTHKRYVRQYERQRCLKVSSSPSLVWNLTCLCWGGRDLTLPLHTRTRNRSSRRKSTGMLHSILLALHVHYGAGVSPASFVLLQATDGGVNAWQKAKKDPV